jgi:Pyruvate/2-oxoacid:ferredoxin oxidoreductase gamma subunit
MDTQTLRLVFLAALLASTGIVESVREVELAEPFGFGQVIEVVNNGVQLFNAGQRVRVVADWRGTRVEHADDALFSQP